MYKSACLELTKEPVLYEPIATSGFPVATDYVYFRGVLAAKQGPSSRPALWRTDMPFNPGHSGGPVYDLHGAVLGYASGSIANAEGLHYFQPITQVASAVRDLAQCNHTNATTTDQPVDLTSEQQDCVTKTFTARHTRQFRRDGSVRCPGGGCLFQSSSCNHRSAELRYDAPPGYLLESPVFTSTGANDAVNGPLQTAADDEGIKSASILLKCAPSAAPGSGGGWSRGQLSGTERIINVRGLMEQVRRECIIAADE